MDYSFLKTERLKRDLSINEVARLTKLSAAYISRIESNKTQVKVSDLITLCNVYDFEIVAKDKINRHKDAHILL